MKKILMLVIIIFCSLMPELLKGQYVSWVKRYNGPVASDYNSDEPTAIAVDNQGNVYVTGSSVGRVAYPMDYYDWATIKYYSNGDTAWVRRYDGPINRDDYAYALAVDVSGNVYVTGSTYTSDSTGFDWLTIKYNANGDIVWSKKFNGTRNQYDEAKAIAIDNQGYIYVTGYSYNSTGWHDYTTIKYNSNGDTVWIRHYNNNAFNGMDEACAIAVDNQGNVYVTGKSYGPGYWYDIATIKYNSAGVQQWVSRYTYSGNNHDEPGAIAIDNQGNVYVTGQSMNPGAYYGGDCVTIKYLSNGDTAWVRRYNGTANDWDEGKDIAVNNQGDVYITGVTTVPGQYGSQQNYLTIKYNSSGIQQWLQRYNLPDTLNGYNIASSIALDTSGNIYVTGLSEDDSLGYDFATIRYNPSGNQQWVVRYNGPGNSDDEATAITVDLAGNVYVTGKSKSYARDYDYATIKYYQAGANDVGIDSIIYPPEQHLRLMPMRPCALVRNFGSSPQTNFPVVCSIIGQSGSVRYVNTKIVSFLASYETTRVYFDYWTPTISETCIVKMRTNLAGDQDPNNDQKIRATDIGSNVLLLSEGFENATFPPPGWQREIVQGGYDWIRRTSNTNPTCSPYEGLAMASYQSYNAPYGSKARLISPPINLGTQPKTCILNFAMYHDPGESGAADSIKIEYSIDGINFIQVSAFSRYQPGSRHWEEHSVELGILSGTIYLGILAFSGYGNNMNIDLVQLYGTLPPFNDVGVDIIITPLSMQQAGLPITPSVRIKNYGINNQSNFPVVCSIISSNGILRYSNTQNVPSILFADTAQVNFTSWTPNIQEVCIVKIRTLVTNDENSTNDQKTIQTEIISAQMLLSEGFNNETFPPLGWQSVIVNGNSNWERTTSNYFPPCIPYEGLAMVSYPSYYANEGEMARLISPPIPIGTPVTCSLKFFMYHDPGYQYTPDSVKIEYSTNGTNFTPVASFARYAPTEGWVEHSVFLGTLSDTIYIGLLAYSGCGNNMNIDYVRLIRAPEYANDVGIDAIIQPTLNQPLINIPITPIARVKNYGTSTQTNFPVSCSIFGISSELLSKLKDAEKSLTFDFLSRLTNADYVLRYADTVKISSLAAGESTQVCFRTWTPTIIEPCIVRIQTNLSSDQNPYNNLKDQMTLVSQYQYFLVQGFNDAIFPPAGWQSVIVQGTYNWERKTSNVDPDCTPYEGTAMASYPSYSANEGEMARLISPPIALGATPIPCSLKFFMYHDPGYSRYPDSIKIEYSTNGTNFTRITAFARYAPSEGWVEHSVFLGTLSDTIYIGLLAYSGYGNNMNIDYVRLFKTEPLVNDLGLEKIVAPGNFHTLNTPITPIALIRNFGAITQTNFQTICSIISPNGTIISSSVTVPSLMPNDTTSVVFQSWTPTITGICTIKMRTNLTNDQYPANNRKQAITQIGTNFTILAEGFNNTIFPPTGWQSVIINGSHNWARKIYNDNPTCLPYEGSAMASFPSYDANSGENARLISPLINLGTLPMACSLKFNMYHDFEYDDYYDYVRVEYSTDGINFIPVDSFLRYQPQSSAWSEHSILLGTFSGTICLGIVGYSDYGNNINIDNVRLFGRAITNDVGIDAIINPSLQHSIFTPMIPIARVKNYGSVTQNNFQVICSIIGTGNEKRMLNNKPNPNIGKEILTDVVRYVDTLRVTSLTPNETLRVSFRSWTPTTPEQCTVKIRTKLANDENPANDRKFITTEIIPGATIITPNGGEIWPGGTTKVIRWTAPQIYTTYLLLLSTNSGLTYPDTIANNLSPTDSTYDWLVPMLNLRTCRVKLAVFDNIGTLVAQDASDADFTIDAQAPSIPILISPLNNAYLRDSLPCFWWHKSTDAENNEDYLKIANDYIIDKNNFKRLTTELGIANYQLQYATNSSFTGATQINLSDTFYQVPTRLTDTTYYWRVRAVDSAGNQSNWSSVWSFEIDTRIPFMPVLISPINNIWLTNTNVIFNWSGVTLNDNPIPLDIAKSKVTEQSPSEFTSPIRYILQVDTNRNFTNPIIDTTSYLYDTLTLSQAKYFWRVRAYDLAGNQGSFSNKDSFGIDFTPPNVPNLVSPANNAILNDSFVRFYWNRSSDNVSGVRNYQIQIANNTNFTNAIDTTLTDTTYLRKLTDTTYYWRVKAFDRANNQSNWSATRSFEIDTRTPNAPVLISPINGIWLTNTTVIFNWSGVTLNDNHIPIVIAKSKATKQSLAEFTSPIRYILQVDTNRNFTNPIIDTTSYLYDTLTLSQAKYFWRVRAYDLAGNQGSFSNKDSFGIDYTPPSVPNLVSPLNGQILNNTTVTFIWRRSSDNLSGVAQYTLQGALDPFFILSYDTIATDTTFTITLPYETTYYWRVKSYDRANNQSNWSAVRNFTIQTTAIEENNNSNHPLITRLYSPTPNPVTNQKTDILFTLAERQHIALKIYDASGTLIKTLVNAYLEPGIYHHLWHCQNEHKQKVADGIYFCTLETQNEKFTRKLILTR